MRPLPQPACQKCGKTNYAYQRGWKNCAFCKAPLPPIDDSFWGTFALARDAAAKAARAQKTSEETEKSIRKEPHGVVYLLKGDSYYKIGKAKDLTKRLNQIKLQLPYPVEVVHIITTDDIGGIERYWHQRFATKRTNGEWFALTAEDVEAFKARSTM